MSFWVSGYLQTLCHVLIFARCVIGYVVSLFFVDWMIFSREINVF
ncbi:hypothetical protein L665_04528 [Ralstonia solanacearum SD54]|nr:hypothetical protein F504_4101 [Ralstonia pseudosolanacearum FQY_4]ANH36076.1 hypothetical protein A3768_5289 [Ralstonia solanacearum]ESS50383.1 hypothetical protein L665_04528 [Ralstonia solanacearum SD54]